MNKKAKSKRLVIIDRLALILTVIAVWIVFLALAWVVLESAANYEIKYYSNTDTSMLDYVRWKTGADVSDGELSFGFDSHGGPHGDGTTYLEIQMPYSIDDRLKNTTVWHDFPIPENVRKVCDLYIDKHNGKDSEHLVPEIHDGFWHFVDRSSDIESDFSIPLNITLAVYDNDTNIMYYCKMDI